MGRLDSNWNRRELLKSGGMAAALAAGSSRLSHAAGKAGVVALVSDPADRIASSQPARRAADRLAAALEQRGITVVRRTSPESDGVTVILAGAQSARAREQLRKAGVEVGAAAESLALAPSKDEHGLTLLACGADPLGLVYATTELTDLVETASDPLDALRAVEATVESPANRVRSLTRLFTSNVEDLPWYHDREMWPQYFDMLVAQRFNRFNLAFGIGYDFIRRVTDAYFLFTYPFLLKVPGYEVRVPQLPDAERERNLETLKYIGEQCAMRGVQFHIGLWMHGYVWIDSPDANYTIEGLTKATHGPYCRDAVRLLLQSVPTIEGVTFRIHGESGVEEGNFDFWKTVFDGVKTCGRPMRIDMHAKGMSQQMIDVGLQTGLPVQLSPKFWAEHLGMPYHQADIRAIEKPKAQNGSGLMALSSGTRSFLRYGYGDLLPENRTWSVVHRIWPGTQRLLLWGDPVFAAGYSRAFGFCGSEGVEIQEMLSFKGRRGSGHAGDRCAYQDNSLKVRWDWQKYEYGTRVWGRMLFNPATKPEVLRRRLVQRFGPGAIALETALANAGRILPIVTTAHAPSAGNNTYWPELYLNQSLVDAEHFGPYRDSPEPRVFGTVSPLDPELFYTIDDYGDDLLAGRSNGKYAPVEVAQWIESYAAAARAALAQADALAIGRTSAAYRRASIDIRIQVGLGEFFAAKLRSGVLFRLYSSTKDRGALEACVAGYRKARAAWAQLAQVAAGVYMSDITVGEEPQLRGHWADRLPAIDRDIDAVAALLSSAQDAQSPSLIAAMKKVLEPVSRAAVRAQHEAPVRFVRGEALELTVQADSASAVNLHYRHVNQAENYETLAMDRRDGKYAASVPASYTQTEFPLEYFFEIVSESAGTLLYPGFDGARTNQPYFVVRSV